MTIGPHRRVAARADDQLEPRRGHRLDQHAVEDEARASRGQWSRTVPGARERCIVGEVEDHAARVALMRERGGLRLEHDRIADPLGDRARLVGIARERACRDRDAEHRQESSCPDIPGAYRGSATDAAERRRDGAALRVAALP